MLISSTASGCTQKQRVGKKRKKKKIKEYPLHSQKTDVFHRSERQQQKDWWSNLGGIEKSCIPKKGLLGDGNNFRKH